MSLVGCLTVLSVLPSLHGDAGGPQEEGRILRLEASPDGETFFFDNEDRIVGILTGTAPALGSVELAPAQLPGWPFVAGEVDGTPTVADIDGDGALDVVFSSGDANLYAVRQDASLLSGWPVSLVFRSSRPVSLVDIEDDGSLEIFHGALDGVQAVRHDGTTLPGWPISGGVFSNVAIDDLDRDGEVEIAVMEGNGTAHLFDAQGNPRPGWPYLFSSSQMSNKGPAFGDVDGNGIGEIVFPISAEPSLFVFGLDGSLFPGFPLSFSGGGLKEGLSLADVNGDGIHEVVLQEASGAWILDGNAFPLPGWPATGVRGGNSPPAVGDIDGDGKLEFVWGTIGGNAEVYALNDDGTLVAGWPVTVSFFTFNAQATIGDVSGDGKPDIVLGGFGSTIDATGRIYAWHADGRTVSGFPISLPDAKTILGSSVTITDLDQDGDVDLIVGAITGLGGTASGRVFAFDLDVPYEPTTMEWPTQAHDIRNTGRYEPPARAVEVALTPPILSLDRPAPAVLLRASLPEDLADRAPVFAVTRLAGRIVRLEGTAVGPVDGAGRVRLTRFDGPALAELIRTTVPGASGPVALEFRADTTPFLTGSASLEVR